MKLVSEGVLEKVKHSFRLSQKCIAEKEKARSKAKEEKETPRKVAGGGASGVRQQVRRERKMALLGAVSVSGVVPGFGV